MAPQPRSRSLLANTLLHSLSSVGSLFLFLLMIMAGRYLGTEDFGRFSFALAFYYPFAPLLDLGLYRLLIREVARREQAAGAYLAHALTWKGGAAPGVFLLVVAASCLIDPSPRAVAIIGLVTLSCILKSFKDVFRAVLLGRERFGLEAASTGGEMFLLFGCGAICLVSGQGLLPFCLMFVVVRLADLGVLALVVHRQICLLRLGRNFGFLRKMVRQSLPIAALLFTLLAYNYFDTIMLRILKDNVEVGFYNAAYRIYEGLLVIPVILGTAFMPRLSRIFQEEGTAGGLLFLRGLKVVYFLGLFILMNGLLLAAVLIPAAFGPAYFPSVSSLRILLSGIVFFFCVNFMQTALITINREKVVILLVLGGLLANAGLNVLLIPHWGQLGAAWATIGVEGGLFFLLLGYFHRTVPLRQWSSFFRLLSAVTPGAALLLWMAAFRVSLLPLQLMVVNVGLPLLFLLAGGLDREERQFLVRLLTEGAAAKGPWMKLLGKR